MFLPFRALPVLAALALGPLAASAQSAPIKYGQMDPRDLTAAPFATDSAAEAVVLCDYGYSRIGGKGEGLQVVFERVTRIKILRKAGYQHATVEVPLYHRDNDQEKLSNLRGFTYNLVNGQVVKTKLETNGTFLEKRTAYTNVQKFTLPNVREGSVIEYAYTVKSDFLFNFQDWTFQHEIPTRWSEYRVSIPVFYKYKIIRQGLRPFALDQTHAGIASMQVADKLPSGAGLAAGLTVGTLNISAPTDERQWALKDVPAFADEPFITTATDYLERLDFELVGEQWPNQPYHDLMGSWEKINQRLLARDDFGQQLDRGNFLKPQMQALAGQYPTLSARAAAVREVVMGAVRYDGTNRYASENPLRRAYNAHRGTAADVNLLLIAALRDAGLPAQPLLLSTRDHGRINREFPLLDRFNYVVGVVRLADGQDLLLDATEPLLPCGVLPRRCLNGAGRLITPVPANSRWVTLKPSQRDVHFRQIALALEARGGLTGKVHDERGGYAGFAARAELAELGEKKYLAQLAAPHPGWTVPKLTVTNREDVTRPLALEYEFSQPAGDNPTAGTLYLSPLRDFGTEQNPFRHDDRLFPVDFGAPQDETTMITLTLPEGYELAEIPKPATIALPDGGGRYLYNVAVAAPGTVQITSRLSLSKPVYAAEEYTNLRELYRLMLEKQAEKLVIKKKA